MKGIFLDSRVFVPDPTQIQILKTVAEKPACHISHVVHQLLPDYSESSVRSGVHKLLSKRYLDGGKANNEILLRITSGGRMALQRTAD
ncbi:MAG: hypothetical protein OS112_07095 [Methanoregula sp.]|nr:MAG: hypothetical protein OS112_07095 [Methanoregula sp.]